MTSFRPGDLVLVTFPFVQGGAGKQRPALVVADTGDDDVLLAHVTTQVQQTAFDVPIGDWRGAGLLAPSFVRLHKLATIEKNLIKRSLGTLIDADRKNVAAVVKRFWAHW